jgi:hypothetical protein
MLPSLPLIFILDPPLLFQIGCRGVVSIPSVSVESPPFSGAVWWFCELSRTTARALCSFGSFMISCDLNEAWPRHFVEYGTIDRVRTVADLVRLAEKAGIAT